MKPSDFIRINVVRLRKLKGWTRKDLADIYGCDYQHIAQIETGKRGIGEVTFKKLLKALDTTPGELLSISSDMDFKALEPIWEKIVELHLLTESGHVSIDVLRSLETIIDNLIKLHKSNSHQ